MSNGHVNGWLSWVQGVATLLLAGLVSLVFMQLGSIDGRLRSIEISGNAALEGRIRVLEISLAGENAEIPAILKRIDNNETKLQNVVNGMQALSERLRHVEGKR